MANNPKESLLEIGASISNHRKSENFFYANIPAIGRALCHLSSNVHGDKGTKVYWLTNKEQSYNGKSYSADGQPVYKNTRFGEILVKYHGGHHQYLGPKYLNRMENVIDVDIYNRATYSLTQDSAKDITIYIDGDTQVYRFQHLKHLINQKNKLVDELAALKKKEEVERLALEKARVAIEKAEEDARKAKEEADRLQREEEARRLSKEARRREEEEVRNKEKMRELEAKIAKSEQSIQECQIFMINGETLRSQHVLDEFQEDAKRSHLYDGVPVVIEGGPGTGKTTTMIQRLKFLISAEALREYDAPLSEQEMNELANPNVRDKNWLFFSPTDKLLGFLRDNMRGEDLNANEVNTTTLHTFCTNMLMAYKLRVPEKDGPFKLDRKSEGRCIEDSAKAIAVFEKFLVRSIASILLKKAKLKTSDYPWHKTAIQIKAYCKNAEKVKDINGLMNLFNSLQDNCKVLVSEQESVLNELKKKLAVIVANAILGDEDTKKKITQLFQSWNDDSEEDIVEEEAENDDDMDESEDDEQESSSLDFDALLYKNLKPLLRNLALSKIDPKTKISKRQKELYELAKSHIDSQDLSELAHLEWFKKNYAFLCRGIESNIFNQIPKRYKLFRREMVKLGHTSFNQVVLQKQLKKNKGSQIHSDELKLIIGFINNMILSVHKKSKTRFESMKNNNYVKAFIENAKPVIGIDEATDYSLLDYYFITSFKHYKHHSITLCGDIMQGLNNDGIENWMELDNILPKLTVYELHTSYRQLPTLVDMSKQLYVDDQGTEAPYCSNAQRREDEPAPLCFISDDLEEKTEWMAKRINEIYKAYDNKMPSVGILVGDNVDIEEMVEIMQDQDILNGIQIFDCSDNKTANSTKCVKIYRLTEVKGMEFEVVFFHDIDTAITTHSEKLMRRYLYVGISRAATHLAATFTEKDGNEDILKYFNPSKINWKL